MEMLEKDDVLLNHLYPFFESNNNYKEITQDINNTRRHMPGSRLYSPIECCTIIFSTVSHQTLFGN